MANPVLPNSPVPVARPSIRSVVVLAGLALLLLSYRLQTIGFAVDDLFLAFDAVKAPWTEIGSLQTGPFLVRIVLWKLGALFSVEHPYYFILVVTFAMHGAATALMWTLARERWDEPVATAVAAVFLLSASASEAWFWASAAGDVQMGLFLLVAFLCWERRTRARRWLAWSFAFVVLAVLSKTSAMLFPAVLWLDAWTQDRRDARALVPALAGLQLVLALLAAWAFLNPGATLDPLTGASPDSIQFYIDGIAALGELLVRLFTLYRFSRFLPEYTLPALGLIVGAAAVLQTRNRTVRFGLIWAVVILLIPVLSRGRAQMRYGYAALPGALLAAVAALEWLGERIPALRGRTPALLGAFAALNLIQYGAWLYRPWYCLDLHDATRAKIRAHGDEVISASQLRTMIRLHTMRITDILKYDLNATVPVTNVDSCDQGGEGPCIGANWPVTTYSECPARGTEESFLFWKSAP
ncbi:MAG: hypothetical protein KDH09_13355 [Chrysiogenetes bacterium]|nr:hypothetical protein [Chrysiogenetes bacterium]